jgi:hypothetical protein
MPNDHNDNLLESLLSITPEDIAAYQAAQAARDRALSDAFEELAEMPPEPYHAKQARVYRRSIKQGHQGTALDALWRAASFLDLLTPAEANYTDLTPARASELIAALGW